ncbi:haloalkane dehalogenase [Pseudonocardia sichuanensis]
MPETPVLDSTIHHTETGAGATFVFLHGNPSSSHMWRDVLPRIGPGRLLAPDLIGMGRSGKPDIPYLFADHARYLDAWFDALGLDDVVLVGHDWGGALACDWAARHPERVRGLALFEAIVAPTRLDALPPRARERAEMIRTRGEELLQSDLLVRQAFTRAVLTPVAEEVLAAYLAPYPDPRSRRPLLRWAQQIPIDGEPAELVARFEAFHRWLAASTDVPKLMLTFDGSPTVSGPAAAAWAAEHLAALEVVPCGAAGHHAAEDRAVEIAAAVAEWSEKHRLR